MSTNSLLPTVAIVDDSATVRRLISQDLTDLGLHVVYGANHGQEFLDYLQTAEKSPDLCLLDINMPIMDGYETASKLKEHYPKMRILGYSTDNASHRVEKIMACGAHGFVVKDTDSSVIVSMLRALFEDAPTT